jgi:hypothetical protein
MWMNHMNSPGFGRPLGSRSDIALTEQQLRSLGVLEQYDLAPVRTRLVWATLLPGARLDPVIFEFRRYLGLGVLTNDSIPMFSRAVDEVWHTALLFSRLYADLCTQAFGRFIHHDPVTAPATVEDTDQAWAYFSDLYTSLYGDLTELWLHDRQAQMAPH